MSWVNETIDLPAAVGESIPAIIINWRKGIHEMEWNEIEWMTGWPSIDEIGGLWAHAPLRQRISFHSFTNEFHFSLVAIDLSCPGEERPALLSFFNNQTELLSLLAEKACCPSITNLFNQFIDWFGELRQRQQRKLNFSSPTQRNLNFLFVSWWTKRYYNSS